MTRPIRDLIDTYALEKNLSLLRAKSGNRFLWGVVKANAYGHGLIGLLPTFDNWVDGLALLDPKEGVDIQNENQTLASITFQNYFRLYEKLAGMTGTADTEAFEFSSIYKLDTVVVPTNRPMIRKDLPDLVYMTEAEIILAIIEDI